MHKRRTRVHLAVNSGSSFITEIKRIYVEFPTSNRKKQMGSLC